MCVCDVQSRANSVLEMCSKAFRTFLLTNHFKSIYEKYENSVDSAWEIKDIIESINNCVQNF